MRGFVDFSWGGRREAWVCRLGFKIPPCSAEDLEDHQTPGVAGGLRLEDISPSPLPRRVDPTRKGKDGFRCLQLSLPALNPPFPTSVLSSSL